MLHALAIESKLCKCQCLVSITFLCTSICRWYVPHGQQSGDFHTFNIMYYYNHLLDYLSKSRGMKSKPFYLRSNQMENQDLEKWGFKIFISGTVIMHMWIEKTLKQLKDDWWNGTSGGPWWSYWEAGLWVTQWYSRDWCHLQAPGSMLNLGYSLCMLSLGLCGYPQVLRFLLSMQVAGWWTVQLPLGVNGLQDARQINEFFSL